MHSHIQACDLTCPIRHNSRHFILNETVSATMVRVARGKYVLKSGLLHHLVVTAAYLPLSFLAVLVDVPPHPSAGIARRVTVSIYHSLVDCCGYSKHRTTMVGPRPDVKCGVSIQVESARSTSQTEHRRLQNPATQTGMFRCLLLEPPSLCKRRRCRQWWRRHRLDYRRFVSNLPSPSDVITMVSGDGLPNGSVSDVVTDCDEKLREEAISGVRRAPLTKCEQPLATAAAPSSQATAGVA